MKNVISEMKNLNKTDLNIELFNILQDGFVEYKGGFFLKCSYGENIKIVVDTKTYHDLSGYEYSTNKINIEDYSIGSDLIGNTFLFLDEFTTKWKLFNSELGCLAYISIQDDEELGIMASFTFHVDREGETIVDRSKINDFVMPLLIRKIH